MTGGTVFVAMRELRRSWRRFVLMGLVVVLVATLSTIIVGLASGLVQQGTSGLKALPFDHLAFQPRSQATFSRSTLGTASLATWREHAKASPVGLSFVNAAQVGSSGESIDLALMGVQADSFLVRRPDARAALSGQPGLVLSDAFQKQGVTVGQRYRIAGTGVVLPVLGFTFSGSYGHVGMAFTSLDTWRRVAYGTRATDRFSAIALRVPARTRIEAVDKLAGTDTLTKAQAYAGSPGYTAETQTMTMIRMFLLVISALVIGAFFTVLTLQRTRQIGLLKAMGASTWYVVRDGLAQIAVVVVGATLVGTAVGAAVVAALSGGSAPVTLSWAATFGSAAILAVAGVLGGAVALRRVSSIEPAIALGVEP